MRPLGWIYCVLPAWQLMLRRQPSAVSLILLAYYLIHELYRGLVPRFRFNDHGHRVTDLRFGIAFAGDL